MVCSEDIGAITGRDRQQDSRDFGYLHENFSFIKMHLKFINASSLHTQIL